jgi:hypothetical protein
MIAYLLFVLYLFASGSLAKALDEFRVHLVFCITGIVQYTVRGGSVSCET